MFIRHRKKNVSRQYPDFAGFSRTRMDLIGRWGRYIEDEEAAIRPALSGSSGN